MPSGKFRAQDKPTRRGAHRGTARVAVDIPDFRVATTSAHCTIIGMTTSEAAPVKYAEEWLHEEILSKPPGELIQVR